MTTKIMRYSHSEPRTSLIRTLVYFLGGVLSVTELSRVVGEITHNTKDPMDLIPDKLCQLCSELFFLLLAL